MAPDMATIAELELPAVIVTAPGGGDARPAAAVRVLDDAAAFGLAEDRRQSHLTER